MARHRNNVQSERTVNRKTFVQEMEAFAEHVKAVIHPDNEGRVRFPGFKLTPAIKGKMREATELMASGRDAEAHATLDGAKYHFNCCQVSYIRRTLVTELRADLNDMIAQRYDEQLVGPVRTAVIGFEAMAQERIIDLDEAARLYRVADDAITTADRKHEEQEQLKHEQRRARQDLEDQESRAREAERRSGKASELLTLIDNLA